MPVGGEEPNLGGRGRDGVFGPVRDWKEDGPRGPRKSRSWGAHFDGAGPVAVWWLTRAADQGMRTRMPSRSQVGSSRWQVSKESTPRWLVPGVSPVRVGGQQVAGGEGCRGRRGCRLRDEMVVSSILSPGLKLVQVGSLRGRTVGRGGPGHVLVRPGARASGSPHQPGWAPGVRPPRGGSARGRSAERRGWAAWPRRHLGPGDKRVQPAGGAFHPSWGVPRRSRPSSGRGAVRRACARRPQARWRPSRPSYAENRWGLFKLDVEVSAALWRAAAPWLPSHSSGPQLSSRKFQSHRNASIAAANRTCAFGCVP